MRGRMVLRTIGPRDLDPSVLRQGALVLCLAMLLSGFALADAGTDPAQDQATEQSVPEISVGGGFL